jgi:hypothetical protein
MLDEREKPPLRDGGLSGTSSECFDTSESAPKTAPAQENLLLNAIKALAAGEICADTLENIPRMLAASGWRSTAALLTHAAECVDAGDFINAEHNRLKARELFIEGNDAFRQFMEARAAKARIEAYQ